MLGKFIAEDFIAIAGEMRQFLASIENTGHSKKIQYGCVVTQELNLIIKLWMSKPSGQNKHNLFTSCNFFSLLAVTSTLAPIFA